MTRIERRLRQRLAAFVVRVLDPGAEHTGDHELHAARAAAERRATVAETLARAVAEQYAQAMALLDRALAQREPVDLRTPDEIRAFEERAS